MIGKTMYSKFLISKMKNYSRSLSVNMTSLYKSYNQLMGKKQIGAFFCENNIVNNSNNTNINQKREKRTDDNQRSIKCFKCGDFGHMSKECPNGTRCFNCGQFGHMSKECTNPPQERRQRRESPNSNMVCHICHKEGHIARSCPERTAMKCFTCGQEGHKSSQCPNRENKL